METKNYFSTDSAGNIIPGAKVYLYQPGTQTPAAGITNINGQPLANPFTAATSGLVQFKAPDGEYDLRVVGGGREFTIRIQCFDGVAFSSLIEGASFTDGLSYVAPGSSLQDRTLADKLSEIISVDDYGRTQSGAAAAIAQAKQSGSGVLIFPPDFAPASPVLSNSITPTLVRSDKPSVLGVLDGFSDSPSLTEDPALWVQKWASYDSGTDRYRQSLGAIFGEINAIGSNSAAAQNDGSWSAIFGNARLQNKNVGTASAPVTDAVGSLTGVIGFAKADFFPGNGTAITGLWAYPSTITASDAEYDALAATGAGWATIGLEVNMQIDHKDNGYRENISGASSTVGAWLHNYRSSATVAKHWNFGAVIDGGAIDGNSANLAPANWAGQYVGLKIDDSVKYGILFGKRFRDGSVMIKGPDSHSLAGSRPLAFADTGDNPVIWGSYTGSTFNDGMMWQNGGSIFFRKAGVNRDLVLNGERIFFGAVTNQVNRFEMYGGATGGAPAIVAAGTDANISIELRTKGSGRVWLGAPYAAQASLTVTGYVEVRDNTGTLRRLAVV